MKAVSSIDIDDLLYKLLKAAVTKGDIKISGGIYDEDDRPDDSVKEDITVNTIEAGHDKPQTATSNINIYVPDQHLKIKNVAQYKKNKERLRVIGDSITALLDAQNLADLEMWIEADTLIAWPEIHQHSRNIRIKWNIH